MRVTISAGDHEPKGHHYMVVDGVGFLVDLSNVAGSLHDPSISRVDWGPRVIHGQAREAGTITRHIGGSTDFYDKAAIKPYLDAYAARKAELMGPKGEVVTKT